MLDDKTQAKLLRDLIDALPNPIFIKDREHRFLVSNRAHMDQLGVKSFAELEGKTDHDLLPHDLADQYRERENRVLAGEPMINVAEQAKFAGGHDRWLLTTKAPLRDDSGEIIGLVGACRDITEHHEVEQALRDAQAQYESLVQGLPLAVFRKALDGTITFANQQLAEQIGRPVKDIIGKTDYDFFPKDLADKYRADDVHVAESGHLFADVEEFRTPEGEKRYVQVYKSAVHNANGQIIGVQGLFWDVTDRMRSGDDEELNAVHEELIASNMKVSEERERRRAAEEQSRNIEALYVSLIESLPMAVFRKDAEGRFTFVNKKLCDTLGVPADEVLGKTDYDFFPKEMADKYRDDDERIMMYEEMFEDTEEFQGDDGKKRHVHVLKTPVHNHRGEVVGVRGMFWDVTERIEAERALQQVQQELSMSGSRIDAERSDRQRLDDPQGQHTQMYANLLETLPMAVFRKDIRGRFTWANEEFCKALGKPLGEIIGRTDNDFSPADMAEKYRQDDVRIMETREQVDVVERHPGPDGSSIYIQTLKAPILDASGDVIGIQGMFWDVTVRIMMGNEPGDHAPK